MKTGKELEKQLSEIGFDKATEALEALHSQTPKDKPITKEQAAEIWAAASSYKWRGFDVWWAEYQKEQEKQTDSEPTPEPIPYETNS